MKTSPFRFKCSCGNTYEIEHCPHLEGLKHGATYLDENGLKRVNYSYTTITHLNWNFIPFDATIVMDELNEIIWEPEYFI